VKELSRTQDRAAVHISVKGSIPLSSDSSFSMGVRQRGDVRGKPREGLESPTSLPLEPTGSESMKVLAHNLLPVGLTRRGPSRVLEVAVRKLMIALESPTRVDKGHVPTSPHPTGGKLLLPSSESVRDFPPSRVGCKASSPMRPTLLPLFNLWES
jgi:hypothetical protein